MISLSMVDVQDMISSDSLSVGDIQDMISSDITVGG